MTNEQREALVSHWLEVELDEAEDARTLAGSFSDDYREGVWHVLSDQMDATHEAIVTNNWRKVEREADALIQAAGLPALDHEGAEFGRLCRRLLLAKQEYLQIESDRWEGKYKARSVVAREGSVPTGAAKAPPSKPFSEVVKLYFKENSRAERTDSQIKAEFDKFITVLGGDRPIASITKEQGRVYKEHVLKNRSPATWNKHHSSLSGLFGLLLVWWTPTYANSAFISNSMGLRYPSVECRRRGL
jgi:hypothetical protein